MAVYESWLLSLVVRRGMQERQRRTGEDLKAMLLDSDSIIFVLARDSVMYWIMCVPHN